MNDTAKVKITEIGQDTVFECIGELDLSNSDEFGLRLWQAAKNATSVVVDLKAATFIDTAVLAYLAKSGKKLTSRGKRLSVVVTIGSHPNYVLETVRFGDLMDIRIVDEKGGEIAELPD